MGDRVAIIGGKTVGRDHFPIAVIDRPLGFATSEFSVDPVSLANMSRWFYRVRKWHIEFHYTFHDGFGSYSGVNSFDFQEQITTDAGSTFALPTKEAHWVIYPRTDNFSGCHIETSGTGFIYNSGLNGDPSRGGAVVDNFFTNRSGDDNLLDVSLLASVPYWYSTGFSMHFVIHGGAGNQEFGTNGTIERVVGSCSLDGGPTCNVYALDDGLGDNPLDAMNITITPIEFWPYATKAGLPVYDTATGAQLRDPLS